MQPQIQIWLWQHATPQDDYPLGATSANMKVSDAN